MSGSGDAPSSLPNPTFLDCLPKGLVGLLEPLCVEGAANVLRAEGVIEPVCGTSLSLILLRRKGLWFWKNPLFFF